MRRLAFVVLALTCSAGSTICALMVRSPSRDGADLAVDEAYKDLGVLRQQEDREAVFVLTNNSRSSIEISRVVSSCACTGSVVAKPDLPPRTSTELKTTLRTGASRGPIGAYLDVLYRVADQEDLKRLRLGLSGKLQPHYQVVPATLDFGPGRSNEQRIVVTANSPPRLEVTGATVPIPPSRSR